MNAARRIVRRGVSRRTRLGSRESALFAQQQLPDFFYALVGALRDARHGIALQLARDLCDILDIVERL